MRNVCVFIVAVVLVLSFGSSNVLADNALNSIVGGTPFYDPDSTGSTTTTNPGGTGNSCLLITGLTINDETSLVTALTNYISNWTATANPSSPFQGTTMARAIIDGSSTQNVNPFLIVAIGEHESGLAAPDKYAPGSYNAFGRMAGPGQPYIAAPAGNGSGVYDWYQWPSWLASVSDPNTDEQSLILGTYIDDGISTIDDFANKYAPAAAGNDTQAYISYLTTAMNDMISDAGNSITCSNPDGPSGAPTPVSPESCDSNITGDSSGLKAAEIAVQQLACWKNGTITSSTAPEDYDFPAGEEWCGYFAGWVYQQAGIGFPGGEGAISWVPNVAEISVTDPTYTYHAVRDATWDYSGIQYNDLVFNENGENFNFSNDYDPTYTPQPGDLAIHTWPGDIPMDHVNIVVGVSGAGQNATITEIGGDQQGTQVWSPTTSVVSYEGPEVESSSSAGIVGYLSP